MKGFFLTGYMPDLSSGSASAGSCILYTPWTSAHPHQHPGREGTRICFPLGCQWQLEALGWEGDVLGSLFLLFPNLFNSVSCRQECSFCASFKPLSALGMGLVSGAMPNAWPCAWPPAQELSSVCIGNLSLQPPALQSSPWNSGMRNIHPCHFSKPTSKLLHALVKEWSLCGCNHWLNEKGYTGICNGI